MAQSQCQHDTYLLPADLDLLLLTTTTELWALAAVGDDEGEQGVARRGGLSRGVFGVNGGLCLALNRSSGE